MVVWLHCMSFSAWFTGSSLHDIMWVVSAVSMVLVSMSLCSTSVTLIGWMIPLAWSIDIWSSLFVMSLAVISSYIIWWSMYYMGGSPEATHLHLNLAWFVWSMVTLLGAGTLATGLVGWEGLGISSFYLVAFGRSRSGISGALITMITNRFGDIFYFLALASCVLGSGPGIVLVALLVAAATKSSQYPFSSWLPAAMAAPTPVSSLVHSSTLVTAGIYILLRMGMSGFTTLAVLGVITMVGGGLVAWCGQDAKKIVALSTLSQLGLMVYTLASCSELLTINHLLTHAYFKSLLFMCVGVLIHSCYGSQESRLSSDNVSPRGSVVMGVSAILSMSGLVATTGAGSKHQILDSFGSHGSFFPLILFVTGSALTVLYSAKLVRSLCGYRMGYTSSGVSSVGAPGVAPLVAGFLGGMAYYLVSYMSSGAGHAHMLGSPFFLILVSVLLLSGGMISSKMSSYLWPGFASGAGSFSFVGGTGGSSPTTDKPPAFLFSGWVGAQSSLVGLIYLISLLL